MSDSNLTPGQARRLERKKAASAAKSQQNKGAVYAGIVIGVIVLCILGIVAISVSRNIKYTSPKAMYSDYLTEEGLIEDLDYSKATFSTPDYKNFVIKKEDVEIDDDTVRGNIDATLASYKEDGAEEAPELTDEFIAEKLQLDMTVDEYKAYVKDQLFQTEFENYVFLQIVAQTVPNELPKAYTKSVRRSLMARDTYEYNFYAMYGLTSAANVYEYYGQDIDTYEQQLRALADEEVCYRIGLQKIFEDAGLTVSADEYQAFVTENAGYEESYGKPFIYQTLIEEKVMDYLKDNGIYED